MVNWNHVGPRGVAGAGDRGQRGTYRSHSGQTEGAAEMLKGGLTAPLISGAEQIRYPSFQSPGHTSESGMGKKGAG